MCRLRNCPEAVVLTIVGLITNFVLGVLETANFFAGQSLDQCGIRPDRFWRAFIIFQMVAVGIITMFAMDRGRLTELLPGYDYNSRVKDLPIKTFFAFEIAGILIFSFLVIISYSTCSVKGVWVGLYYWILTVVGILFAGLLIFLWVVAGYHVFRRYDNYQTWKYLRPYMTRIMNAAIVYFSINKYD